MRKVRGMVYIIVISAVAVASCGEPVPIKEMMLARKAIARALSVKADKYASKEIEAAMKKIYESHDLVVKNEIENAAKSAVESRKLAESAFEISIPLLAKDTIEAAEKSFELATEAYGEKLAPDEFSDARDRLDDANNLFQNKKSYESYLAALEADKLSKNARNAALGRKEILRDAITEVELVIERAKQNNAETNAGDNLKLAEDNLKLARESYDELKLKKGFAAIEIARINADEAQVLSIEKTANDKIKVSEDAVLRAEKSEGSVIAKEEFLAAKESLDNAKQMFTEKKYSECISFANESIRMAEIVIETKKPVEPQKDLSTVKSPEDGEKDFILYKVRFNEQKRDCLWRIAERQYKKALLWKKIYKANEDRIKNPDLIQPGWILKVPKLK